MGHFAVTIVSATQSFQVVAILIQMVATLLAMLCHGWLFQVVNIAKNASLCAMELNVSEDIFLQTTKSQLLFK